MKKLILLLIIATTISSCSNDNPTTNNQIIGEWRLKQVNYYGLEGGTSSEGIIDYNDKNVFYNFKANGELLVTGDDNPGYNSGTYTYVYGEDYLGDAATDSKIVLVKIDGSKWTYNYLNGEMTLGKSYVDGPDLVFVKK